MRMILLVAASTSLVACQTADVQPEQRSPQAQATYDRLLAGKVAGRPQNCLPMLRSNDMQVIDDDTILYRDGRTTYVNRPLGGCNRLSNTGYALVTRSFGSQLCRGDIATVAHLSTGATVGSCSLGDFVPYRAPSDGQQ